MFQTFHATTSPEQGPPRLAQLRKWMSQTNIDGFLVPRADKHQGEYVAACDERLAWLTGFTGSAGFSCVLAQKAGVFIDGRYRIQVKDQVAADFIPVHWPETSLANWLRSEIKGKAVIGFDPWLHTVKEIETTRSELTGTEITLTPCPNGVDAIWDDRPPSPNGKAWSHDIGLSGLGSGEKRKQIADKLKANKQDVAILTMPDSICWLLNIRGSDIPRTPIVQAYATITNEGRMALFSDVSKFKDLGPDPEIDLYDWSDFETHIKNIKGTVLFDPASLPQAAMDAMDGADINLVRGSDPCSLPKACKNEVELSGARLAHRKDAVACIEFLSWFDAQNPSDLTEISVVQSLEKHRRDHGDIHDVSFETISGSGSNGAIVHYRVTNETNRPLDNNSLLLIDSGAQYREGTTDITRVLPIGTPTDRMKSVFTAVLKGMIQVSMLRFPKGVAGAHIDSFARAPLWQMGLDFDHGTGHGVGSFLSVHEGPHRISRISHIPFEVGMIVSNEPGYYSAGEYGIRIENLIVVQRAKKIELGDDREMLSFETLTLVPIDRRLIDSHALSVPERDWLNAYHDRVYREIHSKLSQSAEKWLKAATKPL